MTNVSQTDPDRPLNPLALEEAAVTSPKTAESTESAGESGDIEDVKRAVSPAVAGLFADFDDEFKKDLATEHERAAMEADDLRKEAIEMRGTADVIERLVYSEIDAFENLDKVVGQVQIASEKYSLSLPAELQRAVSEYQTIREQLNTRESVIGEKNPTAAAELRMKIAQSDILKGIFQTIQESSKDVLLKAAEASDEKVRAAVLRTKEAKDVLDAYPELSARSEVVPDDMETAKELCYRSIRDAIEKDLARMFGYDRTKDEELRRQLEYVKKTPWSKITDHYVLGLYYGDRDRYEDAINKALGALKKAPQHRKYTHLLATRVVEDIERQSEEQSLSEKIDSYNKAISQPWTVMRGWKDFLYSAITGKFEEHEIFNCRGALRDSAHFFADVQSVADKETFDHILFETHIRPLKTAEGVLYRAGDKREQDLARYEENRRIMEEIEPYTPGVIEKGKERQYSDLRTAVEAMENMRTRFVEQLANLQKEDEQIIALLDGVIQQQKQIMEQGLEATKPELLITMFTRVQEAIALRFRSVQGGKKTQDETPESS